MIWTDAAADTFLAECILGGFCLFVIVLLLGVVADFGRR